MQPITGFFFFVPSMGVVRQKRSSWEKFLSLLLAEKVSDSLLAGRIEQMNFSQQLVDCSCKQLRVEFVHKYTAVVMDYCTSSIFIIFKCAKKGKVWSM